jgi:GTP cyclohydrolase II
MSNDRVIVPDRARMRLRQVHRAASDLRRGVPVIIEGDGDQIAVLAAETAGPDGLAEMRAAMVDRPMLVLTPARAAAIARMPMSAGGNAVAVTLPDSIWNIEICQALADPLAAQPPVRDVLQLVAPPPHADAAIALAKIGRLLPAIVAVRLTGVSQEMATALGVLEVAAADVLGYAKAEVTGLRRIVSADVPLRGAPDSRVVAFRSDGSAVEHLAIVIGEPERSAAPMVRIHSECFTGDLLGSMRCDCGDQLQGAIRRIAEDGSGILLYLAQEGRGIGLVNKLRAYGLQDRGLDTMDANRALGWDADERNFLIGATMLHIMGIERVRLLTNNPDKLDALTACGIEVVGREPHMFAPNGVNDGYLATKAVRFGHMLD